jgi:nucleoid DNA-binding protein
VNKGELIANVAKEVNSSKQEVGKVLDSIIEEIGKSLKDGKDVTLVGFGTWKKKSRAARTGRNPQTGETIEIPAKNTVTFTAGKPRWPPDDDAP